MKSFRLLPCLALVSCAAFQPAVVAAPYDGLTAASAGLSAAQILRDNPGSASGVYWIDADGAGGNAPLQLFADMSIDGGGWMLVRHAAGSGPWIAVTDNLAGTAALNVGFNTQLRAAVDWTVPFGGAGSPAIGRFLFKTGDDSTWGVLSGADVYQHVQGDNFAPNSTVLASFNTPVAAGGMTNVLNRHGTGTGSDEDPWIGFAGGHIANIGQMLYGENGFGGAHAGFKNAHGGVNVFVRELNVPLLPVPEPAGWATLLAGIAVLAGLRRRLR